MKNTINLFLTFFACITLQAQTTFSCSYNGSTEKIDGSAFENDELEPDAYDVSDLVNRILKAYNLPSARIQVIPSAQVNNALATQQEGKPFILYSKYFVEILQNRPNGNWKLIGIFAHEVGHHILFHTMGNSSSRRELELEADHWAGAALYKLGATRTQAIVCVEECNENGSTTHPPRAERRMAVQSGWDEARQQGGTVPTPIVEDKPTSALEYTETAAGIGFTMKKIPGGTFTMGSSDSEAEAHETPHSVTVSNFYMGKYEVTVGEYLKFCTETNTHWPAWLEKGNNFHVETGSNSYYKNKGYLRSATSLPIAGVSWDDAVAYCEWLSRKSGKTYRLPTEAQWEYGARGGQSYKYAGSDNIDNVAWYGSNSGHKPHPVGQKAGNGYGLYDMSGNLEEWCADWYDSYSSGNSTNPSGPLTGSYRVSGFVHGTVSF